MLKAKSLRSRINFRRAKADKSRKNPDQDAGNCLNSPKNGRSARKQEQSPPHRVVLPSAMPRRQNSRLRVIVEQKENTSAEDEEDCVKTSSSHEVATPPQRLSVAEQQDFARIAKAAAALDNAGNDMFERGEYEKAMATYTKALKLKRRTLSLGQSSSEKAKRNSETLMASVATSINNIGYLRQRSGASPEETMEAYLDSLRIKRQILGNDDLSVGKTLNNIGSVYFSQRQFEEAMTAYVEAITIMESNLGKSHLDVATVNSNIGDVHLARRENDKARQRYSEALDVRWAQLGDHDPKVIRLLEKIASIEMAGTSERIKKTKLQRNDSELAYNSDNERFEFPVQRELRRLRHEVHADIVYVDKLKRDLSLDMIKDKLQMIRGMKEVQEGEEVYGGDVYDDGDDLAPLPSSDSAEMGHVHIIVPEVIRSERSSRRLFIDQEITELRLSLKMTNLETKDAETNFDSDGDDPLGDNQFELGSEGAQQGRRNVSTEPVDGTESQLAKPRVAGTPSRTNGEGSEGDSRSNNLSASERSEALNSVKERLARFKGGGSSGGGGAGKASRRRVERKRESGVEALRSFKLSESNTGTLAN